MQSPTQAFISRWRSRGYEKGESQSYWLELLSDILGVEHPTQFIKFEAQVHLDHTAFIDAVIPATHVLIEQKSLGKALDAKIRQSDGSLRTPFEQAKHYTLELPYSARPRWIVTSNFAEIWIYDMETPEAAPVKIQLENLERDAYLLQFLVDTEQARIHREEQISLAAGTLVGKLYDALQKQYAVPDAPATLHALNMLCVRIVFCLYAEDAGVFPRKLFYNFLKKQNNPRSALIELFKVLNQTPAERDPYLDDELAAFPYVNGGLFADANIEIPRLSAEILSVILEDCSENFDWAGVSPTIFGGVFESTLNPETRRKGGMHYTSPANIHRVIDPLFFDEIRSRLAEAKKIAEPRSRAKKLLALQDQIAALTFLDPACGSGNFLTETFLSLRRVENEIIRETTRESFLALDDTTPIKVSIQQFYGIEINEFAVTVAKTALWIAEHQMMRETQDIVARQLDFLPLKAYANIVHGNALTTDWRTFAASENLTGTLFENKTVPARTYDFIIGNPPFVGSKLQSPEQKNDMLGVFGKKWKNAGILDFVAAWYKIAVDIIAGTPTRCAFVSSNSICQGEQVAALWKPLFEKIKFDFAWRTFKWQSESEAMAHVHCVIIGFSDKNVPAKTKTIFDENGNGVPAKNINTYLMDAPNVFVESRSRPICNVPEIGIGNKPIDGGNYLFTDEEKKEFLKKEPTAEKYFKKWLGADEFLNNWQRWCLWLGDCPPNELRAMKHAYERVCAVRELRLASKSAGTRKLAETPTRFHVENMPTGTSILVPSTSSERREYVPMGFLDAGTISSNANLIIPAGTLYEFGILESSLHMAWLRAVCGRLETRYRYSASVVYNNFPWAEISAAARERIEKTAQEILDARALYPDASLADLYDPITMPPELRRAHAANDRAVLEVYGFPPNLSEPEIVAELMKLYQKLTAGTQK